MTSKWATRWGLSTNQNLLIIYLIEVSIFGAPWLVHSLCMWMQHDLWKRVADRDVRPETWWVFEIAVTVDSARLSVSPFFHENWMAIWNHSVFSDTHAFKTMQSSLTCVEQKWHTSTLTTHGPGWKWDVGFSCWIAALMSFSRDLFLRMRSRAITEAQLSSDFCPTGNVILFLFCWRVQTERMECHAVWKPRLVNDCKYDVLRNLIEQCPKP